MPRKRRSTSKAESGVKRRKKSEEDENLQPSKVDEEKGVEKETKERHGASQDFFAQVVSFNSLGPFAKQVALESMAIPVEQAVEHFVQSKSNNKDTVEILRFFSFCIERVHLKSVRESVFLLLSSELWEYVPAECRSRFLAASPALKRQWKVLKDKAKDPVAARLTPLFWKTLLDHVFNTSGDATVLFWSLTFVYRCLRMPVTRRFLQLFLEGVNFLSLCELFNVGEGDRRNTWLRQEILHSLVVGDKSEDDLERLFTCRVRLLQRVGLLHFESELRDLVILSSSQVSARVAKGFLESLSIDVLQKLNQLLGVCHSPPSPFEAFFTDDKGFHMSALKTFLSPVSSCEQEIHKGCQERQFFDLGDARPLRLTSLQHSAEELAFEISELGTQTQYVTEQNLIRCELLKLGKQSSLTAVKDVLSTLGAVTLRKKKKKEEEESIGLGRWARMALDARLIGRKTLSVSFAGVPPMIVDEWESLRYSQSPVIVCALEKDADEIVISDFWVGFVQNVDAKAGRIVCSWWSQSEPGLNARRPFVIVRRRPESDLARRIGVAMINQIQRLPTPQILPVRLKSAFLGVSAKQVASEKVRLVSVSSDLKDALETVVSSTTENMETDDGTRVLVVAESQLLLDMFAQGIEENTTLQGSKVSRGALIQRIQLCLAKRLELLDQVAEILSGVGIENNSTLTCQSAQVVYDLYVRPELERYLSAQKPPPFPFAFFFGGRDDVQEKNATHIALLQTIFQELNSLTMFELLLDNESRMEYILHRHSQVLYASVEDLVQLQVDRRLEVNRVVFLDSACTTQAMAALAMSLCEPAKLEALYLVGNPVACRPKSWLDPISLYDRFKNMGLSTVDGEGTTQDKYESMLNGLFAKEQECVGLASLVQFVDVKDSKERAVGNGQFQNVEEAEFAISLYMYLVLLGYAAYEISIVTPYAAQKLLLLDVVHARLSSATSPLPFPGFVGSVDDLPGMTSQCKIAIVSSCCRGSRGVLEDARLSAKLIACASSGVLWLGDSAAYGDDTVWSSVLESHPKTALELDWSPEESSASSSKRKKSKKDVQFVDSPQALGIIVAQMRWSRPLSLLQ